MKPVLFNFTDPALENFLVDMGQPKFRAKQIRDWLNRGAPDFASMIIFSLFPIPLFNNGYAPRIEHVV